jgi:hypothetical protein
MRISWFVPAGAYLNFTGNFKTYLKYFEVGEGYITHIYELPH